MHESRNTQHAMRRRNILPALPGLKINGRDAPRLPNTSSLTFPGVEADALLLNLPEVMMGTGAACSSGALEPSHVLMAMGLSRAEAAATVRASLGRLTDRRDIEHAAARIAAAVRAMTGPLAQA